MTYKLLVSNATCYKKLTALLWCTTRFLNFRILKFSICIPTNHYDLGVMITILRPLYDITIVVSQLRLNQAQRGSLL